MPSASSEASSAPQASPSANDSLNKAHAFGRLMTALSLENKVLANGVLPEKSIQERAAIVEGIVAEKLNAGAWDEAVMLVYDPQSPARLLYSGNRAAFNQQALAAAQHLQPRKIPYLGAPAKALDLLAQQGNYDIVLQFLETLPLTYEQTAKWLPSNKWRNLNETQQNRLEKLYAHRAHAEQRYPEAITHYRNIGNTEALDVLFNKMLAADEAHDCFGVLLDLAFSEKEKKESRLLRIFKEKTRKRGLDARFSYNIVEKLYKILRKENLPLPLEQATLLYNAAAQQFSWRDIKEVQNDDCLQLFWAKKRALNEPAAAYAIFHRLSYEGPELFDALVAGLQRPSYGDENKDQHIFYEDAKPEHLTALLRRQDAPLDVRAKIAKHLDDKPRLRAFSRQYAKQGQTREAYHCFMRGNGDAMSAYASSLRTSLIAEEMKKDFSRFHTIEDNDAPGHYEVYTALRGAGKITQAYELARKIERDFYNSAPLNGARNEILENNPPTKAYEFFVQEKDDVGAQRALTALATQYRTSAEEVTALIAAYKGK